MDLKFFEASPAPEAVSRIIGAFFGNAASYFTLKSKDREKFESEFRLGVFDAELKALHRLSLEKSPSSFDGAGRGRGGGASARPTATGGIRLWVSRRSCGSPR